ncbi:protein phosphatase 2C domain-containing protein [Saccharomonospora sp. NPDC006951]
MTDEAAGSTQQAVACPHCAEPVGAADRFCEGCGGSLLVCRTPLGGPQGRVASGDCVACGGTQLDPDGFCAECGRAQPSGRDRMEYDLGFVAGVSDRGKRRSRNEDSMAFAVVNSPDHGEAVVAVVCDGVATSERADSASQAAVDAALAALVEGVLDRIGDEPATSAGVAAASEAVAALARPEAPGIAPSCTYVSAVVTGERVTVGWVGDSRAYWLGSPSSSLTADDTVAAELMAEGMSEVDALSVPQAHALSRWIGADAATAAPGIATIEPGEPGYLLLCSDGLWNYVPEAGTLHDLVRTAVSSVSSGSAVPVFEPGAGERKAGTAPMTAAVELTRLAIELGGNDNITVVVVPFPLAGDLAKEHGR